MNRRHRIAVVFALLALAAGAALTAQVSSAAPAGGWARISGPTQAGSQLGLARTADGVLHVIWNRGNTGTSISETRISADGKVSGSTTVAIGWNGNGGLALLALPDKSLRLFAAGTNGINAFAAPESGGSWAQSAGAWGGAVAEASGVIGAALTKDGQPVTAWRGNAAAGAPPSSVPSGGYEPGMTESFLATDASSGAVVLAGSTNAGQGGFYVQQILPSTGARVVIPPLAKDWGDGLSARIGQPGVFLAYADGSAAHLVRYGGASKTLARGPFSSATVCSAPDGRLWVVWGSGDGSLFVTRSNRAVGGFEPVQRLKLGGGALTWVQCEGSSGPADLFASGQFGTGFWHTHVLARLSARATVGKGKATISVRDAGDAVSGAAVVVGSRKVTTDARGQATLAVRPGSYTAHVTAAGYAAASVGFKAPRKTR